MPSDCLSETFEYEEALPFCLSLLSFLESFFFQIADVKLIDSGHGFSLSEFLYWSGSGAVFAVGRKTQQFCEARFVSLAHGTVAIGLNPFGMFPEQRFVNLPLKLNIRLDFLRSPSRSVRLHGQYHRQQVTNSHCAWVGFSFATRGVIRPPSFEVGLSG
jgi:hypothetical protein